MQSFDVVIIGGGVAAYTVAEEIVMQKAPFSICIISDEGLIPYYRLKLADYLHKDIDKRFFLTTEEWFSSNNVSIFLNSKVTEIDFENRVVHTTNTKFSYRFCVIASGARPNIVSDKLSNNHINKIFCFRNYNDLQRLKMVLNNISSITIVGAGLLGLEIASQLENYKLYIVETAPRLLPRQLDQFGSSFIEQRIRKNNIELFLNDGIKNINLVKNTLSIELSSCMRIESDILIFAAGVEPNIDFVSDKLKTDRGVRVNNVMKTNIDDVFACGDVANLDNFRPGTWNFAIDSAKVVARNIIGLFEEYKKKDYPYFLKAFNTTIISVGNLDQFENANIYEFIDQANFVYKKFFIKDRNLIGYILINDIKPHMELSKHYMKEIDIKKIESYLK